MRQYFPLTKYSKAISRVCNFRAQPKERKAAVQKSHKDYYSIIVLLVYTKYARDVSRETANFGKLFN